MLLSFKADYTFKVTKNDNVTRSQNHNSNSNSILIVCKANVLANQLNQWISRFFFFLKII